MLTESEIASLSLSAPVPLTKHPAAVYLSSLAPGSRCTMRSSLNAIARLLTGSRLDAMTLDWSKLRYQHTAAIRTALGQRLAPTTVNKMLVGLRRVLQEAYRLDLMNSDDYAKAADLKSFRVQNSLRGRELSLEEIKSLIANSLEEGTVIGLRDAAVISVLRGTGIRREELAELSLKNVNLETGEVMIRHGKGDKDRLVYLNEVGKELLQKWLEVRGDAPGALICPVNKGGKVTIRHLSSYGDGVYKLVKERAKKAGIANFSPHDFRRTFCTNLLEAGIDIFTVQDLMGHLSANTTKKYDKRGEARKKQAVQKLKFN